MACVWPTCRRTPSKERQDQRQGGQSAICATDHFAFSHRTCDSLLDPDAVDVDHNCEYIIPSGDVPICAICEKSEDPNFDRDSGQKRMQPPDTDRNAHSLVKFGKAITELGNGSVLCSNLEVELNLPKNRAERRRRLRGTKKQPSWGEPVLIHEAQGIVRVNDAQPIQVQTATPFVAPSAGFLVVTVSTTPLRSGSFNTPPFSRRGFGVGVKLQAQTL